jgi:membrane-associated phospholipid phosphatase
MFAGMAALLLALVTAGGRGRGLDRRLYRRLNRARGPRSDRFFWTVTELGSIWASAGAAALLAVRGRRREGLDALGAAGAMWVLGQLAKRAVDRPRPYLAMRDVRLLIDRPQGTSWPSSHPAVLLAFVTVAGRDLGLSLPARAGAAAVAGTVGFSRVYLGVHYPADVVGGLLLGRGVADLWSSLASPGVLRPAPAGPVQ